MNIVAAAGKSLLWVAVLGFIVFYLYALISFAMLRSSFDPDKNLYCATLWQCTVTVIRYGLVGDIFDVSSSQSVYMTEDYCTNDGLYNRPAGTQTRRHSVYGSASDSPVAW